MAIPAAESFEMLYYNPPRERRVHFTAQENIGMIFVPLGPRDVLDFV